MDMDKDKESLLSQYIILKDGRKLGYAEHGDSNGPVLLEFHGFSDSRMEILLTKAIAPDLKVRHIVLDRPGIGLSDKKSNRTVLDWADDVEEFLVQLNIDKVLLIGFSLGAIYVYGCVYKIPERIIACGIISGASCIKFVSDYYPKILTKLLKLKGINKFLMRLYFHFGTKAYHKNLETSIKYLEKRQFNDEFPKKEAQMHEDPEMVKAIAIMHFEGCKQKTKGVLGEMCAYTGCGYELTDLSKDIKIYMWHSKKDHVISIKIAERVASLLPNSEYVIFEDEGHTSTYVNHPEIFYKLQDILLEHRD